MLWVFGTCGFIVALQSTYRCSLSQYKATASYGRVLEHNLLVTFLSLPSAGQPLSQWVYQTSIPSCSQRSVAIWIHLVLERIQFGNGFFFHLMQIRRKILSQMTDETTVSSVLAANFSAGFIAGSLSAAATCPLDVAKTRRQIEVSSLNQAPSTYMFLLFVLSWSQ